MLILPTLYWLILLMQVRTQKTYALSVRGGIAAVVG